MDIDNSIESITTDTPILEHDSICLNESDIICKENGTNNYTIDDYKTIIKMLKSLKIHSNSSNIKLDDAVAISLINNYSIEDCLKFKRLLENNLN